MGLPKMFDIPCHFDSQFICEFDESVNEVKTFDLLEQSKFLKPLTNYRKYMFSKMSYLSNIFEIFNSIEIGSLEKELFSSIYDVDWLTAILICKNFGMELLTPTSAEEDNILRKKLEKLDDIWTTFHVGVTSMGTKDLWYAVNSGKIFDFDLEWSKSSYYPSYSYPSYSHCVGLRKRYEKYSYETVNCINAPSHFICQKVIDSK